MNIGIIGAGHIGSVLARKLGAAGHAVRVANSRGPETLRDLAAETGATAVTVADAVKGVDVVIVTIPEKNVPDLPADLFAGVPDDVVVLDTGNYYPSRDGRIAELDGGLAESQWVAQVLGRPVVKAFNNIVATSLATRGVPAGTPGRVCLSVAGDDARGKQVVLGLVEALGFDGLDAGTLADSWRQQPGTPAYCRDLGTAELKAALAQAEAAKVARYRDDADEAARPYFTPTTVRST
jgi:predicted dinucleotide-binding enzyme